MFLAAFQDATTKWVKKSNEDNFRSKITSIIFIIIMIIVIALLSLLLLKCE